MELKEIHAKQVTVEVRDEATGEVFRRTLPMEYYETANFLRLSGEKTEKENPVSWFFCRIPECGVSEI